jgi:hypothetical protein
MQARQQRKCVSLFGDLEPLKRLLTFRVQHLSVHVDQSVETKVDDSFGAQAISV